MRDLKGPMPRKNGVMTRRVKRVERADRAMEMLLRVPGSVM